MTRQSRNFCTNDCAISENPIGEGTVSWDIDNDAKMKLVCNPDKNSITSLAVLQNWIHCYHLNLVFLFVLFLYQIFFNAKHNIESFFFWRAEWRNVAMGVKMYRKDWHVKEWGEPAKIWSGKPIINWKAYPLLLSCKETQLFYFENGYGFLWH